MASSIGKKIVFARQSKVKQFIQRYERLADCQPLEGKLIQFAFGVCLSNPSISKGFLKKLDAIHPLITAKVTQELAKRESAKAKQIQQRTIG